MMNKNNSGTAGVPATPISIPKDVEEQSLSNWCVLRFSKRSERRVAMEIDCISSKNPCSHLTQI